MLKDLLDSIRLPCSPYIRRMGYLTEAIEMRGRARRHTTAWHSHLERSRSFILASAETCPTRNRVAILGSGLLLDVPLVDLSTMFREVVLMDVVCLPEIRKLIARHSNARFIEHDVTGVAERVLLTGQRGGSELPEPTPELSGEIRDSSLVVSLNILSQLWVVPRAYASRHMRGLDEYAVDEWCGRIVAAHYGALKSLSCDVCLIADHAFVKRIRTGEVISRGSTVYDLELPEPDRTWTWNISPLDDQTGAGSKELIVGAWHLRQNG
jgi:hypothetical protein